MDKLTITGTVQHVQSKLPLPNLTIEAWDQDVVGDDFLGRTTSDSSGRFQLDVKPEDFREALLDRFPDIYFKIYSGKILLKSTADEVINDYEQEKLDITLEVDPGNEKIGEIMHYRVRGQVRMNNGSLAGLSIKVFRQQLRGRSIVGSGETDAKGQFDVSYIPVEKAGIQVQVFNPGSQDEIASSDLILKPTPEMKLELEVNAEKFSGPSLFESLQAALKELPTDPKETSDEQLQLLALESGFEAKDLRQAQQAQVAASNKNSLPAEVLFAVLQINQEEDLSNAESLNIGQVKHAVTTGLANNVLNRKQATTWTKAVESHEKQLINNRLSTGRFTSKTSLRDVWTAAKISSKEQDLISSRWPSDNTESAAFWESFRRDPDTQKLVPKLQLLTQLNNLTFGNLSLIQKLEAATKGDSLESLAGWSEKQWQTVIDKEAIPEEFEKDAAAYAQSMKRMVDYLFPNSAMRTSLLADEGVSKTDRAQFQQFYNQNPDFDIASQEASRYLKQTKKALDGIKDPEKFTEDLMVLQHQFNLSPAADTYANVQVLRSLDIKRSSRILDRSWTIFSSDYQQAGGLESHARYVYDKAYQVGIATGFATAALQIDMQVQPYALKSLILEDPAWESLFGSEDYCSCSHCRSVYSPTAYLTDCLHFLENRGIGDTNAYSVLDSRRPDIKQILLNCANANTPMPYIDLANEVMEACVSNRAISDLNDAANLQTTRSAEELRAQPEHIRMSAYETLRSAVYPFSLPFDLFNRLGGIYLEHLGVAHQNLVELFPNAPQPELQAEEQLMAALGTNRTGLQLILGQEYERREAEYWGLDENTSPVELEKLNTMLAASKLSLSELEEVLATRFVDPQAKLAIHFRVPCSTEHANITELDQAARKRIMQLLRLSDTLQLSVRTTDHILRALEIQEIEAEDLEVIAALQQLHDRFEIPYAELVSWVGVLPTAYSVDSDGHQERYEMLFLGHFEDQEEEIQELFAPWQVTNNGLDSENANYSIIFNHILGALGLESEMLELLIGRLPDRDLSLANLSALAGYVSLAEALELDIMELIAIEELVIPQPTNRLQDIQHVIAWLDTLKASEVALETVLVLFDWVMDEGLTAAERVEILTDLREGLVRFDQGQEPNAPDTQETFVFQWLANRFQLSENQVALLLQKDENDTSVLTYAENGARLSYLDELLNPAFFNGVEPIVSDQHPNLEQLLDLLEKISLFFDQLSFEERHYEAWLSGTNSTRWMNLNHWVEDPTALVTSLEIVLQIEQLVRDNPSETNVFDLFDGNAADTEAWLEDLRAFFNDPDIDQVLTAMQVSVDQATDPSTYHKILDVQALESRLGIRIRDYLNDAGRFAWGVAELSASQVQEIIQVAKAKHGSENWQRITQELRDPIREEQRDALIAYLTANFQTRLGQPLDTAEKLYAHLLLDVEMSACTITSRIKLAVSSVQLFVQRYLMNLEPDVPAQGISPEERAEWEEWVWRKNYRVWEANRKVFLYPENWLEPEWRDNKTEFFKEFESDLQSEALTSENVQAAYREYLEKLVDVSNLEIRAVCPVGGVPNIPERAWIFGRTLSVPHELYFRDFEVGTLRFSSWKKIDLEVDTDHMLTVFHKGYLHLFWPTFEEATNNQEDIEAGRASQFNVRLMYSVYKQDRWSAPKLFKQYIPLASDFPMELETLKGLFLLFYDQESIYPLVRSTGNALTYEYFYRLNLSGSNETIEPDISTNNAGLKKQLLPTTTVTFVGGNADLFPFFFHKQRAYHNLEFPLTYSLFYDHLGRFIPDVRDDELYLTGPLDGFFANTFFVKPCPFVFQSDRTTLLLLKDPTSLKLKLVSLRTYAPSALARNIDEQGFFSSQFKLSLDRFQKTGFRPDNFWEFNPTVFQDPDAFDTIHWDIDNPAHNSYIWETAFHMPVTIANRFRQDQQFEEAQRWFHLVFDPLNQEFGAAEGNFWKFRPFSDLVEAGEAENAFNIRAWMQALNDEADSPGIQGLEQAVRDWEQDPFNPHGIARGRIIAYMKWTVMRYIDNLIEWGDHLFRRDTIESLNEATQLYMLARNILGPEPQQLAGIPSKDYTYSGLRSRLDEFSNASVLIERRILDSLERQLREQNADLGRLGDPTFDIDTSNINNQLANGWGLIPTDQPDFMDPNQLDRARVPFNQRNKQSEEAANLVNLVIRESLYFCIPQNDKLLGYWTRVQDRFYKLRNCQNLQGVTRQLPLYEPPIDPALLVRARAAGLSIADALSSQFAPRSVYRFVPLLQLAKEYARDVQEFGLLILETLEKQEEGKLEALRIQQTLQLEQATAQVKKTQIQELSAAHKALKESVNHAKARKDFFNSRALQKKSPTEKEASDMGTNVLFAKLAEKGLLASGKIVSLIWPISEIGTSGNGVHKVAKSGSSKAIKSIELAAKMAEGTAVYYGKKEKKALKNAFYERRSDDWKLQLKLAKTDLATLEKKVVASEIRQAIAELELENHRLQMDQSREELEFLQTRYTNVELYQWMIGQLKTLYFQSYQLAFDLAQQVEQAFAYELGTEANNEFIRFGHWNGLREGLLSGEKLSLDLKRMEVTYLERNARRQEVSQTYSLALFNPGELINLQQSGTCQFTVPQLFFDLAFDSHINRRIKSVSISIPAEAAANTGLHGTLAMDTERISTSSAVNDSGLFELRFDDERYLPFEGNDPVDSSWTFTLNQQLRSFDYSSIEDVMLHIDYTAEQGDQPVNILDQLSGVQLPRITSLAKEFPEAWESLRNDGNPVNLDLDRSFFPFEHRDITVSNVSVTQIAAIPEQANPPVVAQVSNLQDDVFRLTVTSNGNLNDVEDVILIIGYELS